MQAWHDLGWCGHFYIGVAPICSGDTANIKRVFIYFVLFLGNNIFQTLSWYFKSCQIVLVWNAGQLETHRPQNVHEKQTTSLFFGSLRNWSNKKSVSLHFIKGLMSSFTGSRTWVLNKQLAKFMNPWYSCLTGLLKSISSYRLGTFTPGRFVYGTAVNIHFVSLHIYLSLFKKLLAKNHLGLLLASYNTYQSHKCFYTYFLDRTVRLFVFNKTNPQNLIFT